MRGVLLLAHGTPESTAQMPEYLTLVRGGRPPSDELIREMTANYAAIGGRSPLTWLTEAQAEALRQELGPGVPVYVGMRNWRPFVADVLLAAARDGVDELLVVPLAPQYSTLSVGKYRDAVEKALPPGLRARFVDAWHDDPGLLQAFAEKLRDARAAHPDATVVFTAHSLPRRVTQEGDPYPEQVARTARGVAALVGLERYSLSYQSAGRTPEPWLEPSLEQTLSELAAEGCRSVLVAPIGFVCDHTEVLFDLDVQARASARARGMQLTRTDSLNVSPTFVRALASLVRRSLPDVG